MSGKPRRPGDLLAIRSLTLRDVSLFLSFPIWALALDGTDAQLKLQVTGKGGRTLLLFDIQDVNAKRGGSLRVGPAGKGWTPAVPFDRVEIARVAILDTAPQDLLLEVKEGRTAEAVLSGTAVFKDIFDAGLPRGRPGMKLDAHWKEFGQALQRNPNWAEVGTRLAALNAGVDVSLEGPFSALLGAAAVTGKGLSLSGRLLPRQHYGLDVRFDRLDTKPLLPPSWRDRLGGRLDGRMVVSAKLGSGSAVSVDRLELDLMRHRQVDGPRRLVVSRTVGPSSSEELRIGLGPITLRQDVLRVAALRVRGPGVQFASNLRAERQPGSGAFLLQAATEPSSRLAVGGETFVLPPLVRVRFEPGRALALRPFSLERVGGGAIDLGGSLRLDGQADLSATVRAYPLAGIPGLADARVPGQAAPLARLLRGQLDGALRIAGPTAHPRLSGVLATTGVRWAGQRLGDGRVVFQGIADGTRFEGALIDGVDVRGQLRRQARPDDFVAVGLRDLRLGSWLPHPAAALGLRASGDVVVQAPTRAPRTSATGDLSISGPGVAVSVRARLRPEQGTASVQGRVDLGRVDLGQLKAAFPALCLQRAAGVISADLSWQAAAGGAAGLWPYARYPEAMAGVDGTIAVAERLSLWSARLPSAATVPPTRLELHGDELQVPGVEVHMNDVHATAAGRVHDIDWSHPESSGLDAKLTFVAEGRDLRPWLGDGATYAGGARFAGALSGSVRAPRVAGQANLDNLTVSWPRSPLGPVHVDGPIGIDGRKLAVGPLRVRFENGGWLEIAGSRGAGRLTVDPGRAPFPVDDVDLTVRGSGLGTTRPVRGLSVKDLALGLRLAETGDDKLRVAGEVRLGHTVFDLKNRGKDAKADGAKKTKAAPATPAGQPRAVDRITVDVLVTGPADAVEVRVPYAPDVTVGLRCLVRGALASPRVSGEVKGSGVYSRLALRVADRFVDRELRQCDFGPH